MQGEAFIQVPDLWGSKEPVMPQNFKPVNLELFNFDPLDYAPPSWDGRLLLLLVMKDGTPHTRLTFHITSV